MTTAAWMRHFVTSHPDYQHDSVVSEKINYDLIAKLRDITEERCSCPELLGKLTSRATPKRPKCPQPQTEAVPDQPQLDQSAATASGAHP